MPVVVPNSIIHIPAIVSGLLEEICWACAATQTLSVYMLRQGYSILAYPIFGAIWGFDRFGMGQPGMKSACLGIRCFGFSLLLFYLSILMGLAHAGVHGE